MPQKSVPGVYVQEIPSGTRPISAVPTSVTAFVGRTRSGPIDQPVRITNFHEFHLEYGGLWRSSRLSFAVQQFFENGGTDAVIVRVFNGDKDTGTASVTLPASTGDLMLAARSPGTWALDLRVSVKHSVDHKAEFDLLVEQLVVDPGTKVLRSETYRGLSTDPASACHVGTVLDRDSRLIKAEKIPTSGVRPDDGTYHVGSHPKDRHPNDGAAITDAVVVGVRERGTGMYALADKTEFNLLCIPPLSETADVSEGSWGHAARFCLEKKAMLLIDPPKWWTEQTPIHIPQALSGLNDIKAAIGSTALGNAVAYLPRVVMQDPTNGYSPTEFSPCGAVAGIMARIDAQDGVWKAPAGVDAIVMGASGLSHEIERDDLGTLNAASLNAIKSSAGLGQVVWGGRTLAGAGNTSSEWKYVPVRRLAHLLESSIDKGTAWVVFEPNDEPLWAQVRRSVTAFMTKFWQQGAFQGTTPDQAFFVKCDRATMTQSDINQGILNIQIGFAPLKPAEFVVLEIRQKTK